MFQGEPFLYAWIRGALKVKLTIAIRVFQGPLMLVLSL